jgi:adenosylhomocysteine nucleosidase
MSSYILAISFDEEASLILQKFSRTIKICKSYVTNIVYYNFVCNNNTYYLLTTGIGKVNAANKIGYIYLELSGQGIIIDSIINIGTCGATPDFKVCDKILVSETKYHDFDLSGFGYAKGQVPKEPEYFLTNERHIDIFKNIKAIKKAILLTGDYFMEKKYPLLDSYICDMEGAAIYQTALDYNLECVSIKIVSDIILKSENSNNLADYKQFEKEKVGLYMYDLFMEISKILGGIRK